MHFTEDDFENAILELFREQLGYDYVYSPNVIRNRFTWRYWRLCCRRSIVVCHRPLLTKPW